MHTYCRYYVRSMADAGRHILHRLPLASAACALLLLAFMMLGGPARLQAQCGDGVHDFCNDTCCQTDVLLLNSGFNHLSGRLYERGASDGYWVVTEDDSPETDDPRAAVVLDPVVEGFADAYPNTAWIGATDPGPISVSNATYEKCFCVCDSSTTLTFTLNVTSNVDMRIPVYLDGVLVGSGPGAVTFTRTLGAGRHCISVPISNAGPRAALNVQGTIQGHGLLKYNCCGPLPLAVSTCRTKHLQFSTDGTWTLVSGPANTGSYPRCADVVAPQLWVPIAGTTWIGPSSNAASGPPISPAVYVYRKNFCVDSAGTYVITVQSMTDDIGDIYVNGVNLGPAGTFSGATTQTFIVGLGFGCNCIEFEVTDLFFSITGLNAKIDIQGAALLNPECCDCGSCAAGQRPGQQHNDLGDGGNARMSGVGHNATDRVAARPMLVSIPNPANGESVVHYVIDADAHAQLELYDAAGHRVLVVDDGARTRGAHEVPLVTKGLPTGAYHLRLTYGEQHLTVPLNVR